MLTIPSKEEIRAAAIDLELHRDEQQAEQIRRLVVQQLRETVEQIHHWLISQAQWPPSEHALKGTITNAIATGLEIGLLVGEGRERMPRSEQP